ncbi:RDD family protein [Streptomyces sp. NPDC002506]|uniref:RDD family protein n=1 Tax=Streptomyces sp. NPDC002506 TaxID=3154536 RepID=UPI00332A89D6
MSTDQPPPGQPPEDDPFLKKPSEPPGSGAPYGGAQPPPAGPPPGDSPHGSGPPPGGAGPYGAPPPSGGAGPYGGPPPPGGGSPYGSAPPPPSDPYGGGYGGVDPLAGMPPLADYGKRFLARVIDFLIIAVPLGLIEWATSNRVVISTTDNGDSGTEVISKAYSGTGLLWLLITLVVYVGYDTLMVSKSGQTLGKKLLGLRVAMLNDGSVPTTNASLARAAVLWAPFVLCCYCLWDIVLAITIVADKPYRQGWHDKAGKTVVVVSTPQ